MDERRNNIRELEIKNLADTEIRNRLLEALGESIFKLIGDGQPFPEDTGNTPGGILTEYRRLQKEIEESEELIRTLEADITRLRELEDEITSGEDEQFRLEKELSEVYIRLGKTILSSPNVDEFNGNFRQQENAILLKIEEQENKLKELDEREGNILTWLGKNAQMAVTKAFLSKNQTALERIYLNTGENAFSDFSAGKPDDSSEWRSSEDARNASALKERLSSVSVNLAMLKGERRQMGGLFEADVSPARRIQGLEKRIAFVREEFPAVNLRLGSLALDGEGREALFPFLREEDNQVFESADQIRIRMAERDLEMEKIRAAIKIDEEKAEIEKANRAILVHRQKIAAAETAIIELEKQIAESGKRIEELEAFLHKSE